MPTGCYIRTTQHKVALSLSKSGKKHPLYGKSHLFSTLVKMRQSKLGNKNPQYGAHLSKEHKAAISVAMSGVKHPMYGKQHSLLARCKMSKAAIGNSKRRGKHHTAHTILKQRVAALKRMLRDGTVLAIGKNEKALLDKQAHLDGVTILRQHPIMKLGYIVDGYCPETNTVYEVYERAHKRRVKKDAVREAEIRQQLSCNVVVIWDEREEINAE